MALRPPSHRSTAAQRGLRRPLLGLIALTTLWVTAGCDRNIEPYQPGEEARPPDLARIFPAPIAGGPADGPRAGEGPRGAQDGGTPRGAVPPSRAQANAGAATSSGGAAIRGEIALDPAVAAARPAGGVLFVIARPRGAQGGPPLAVLRIPSPDFPLAFSIGPENVMIPTMTFAGEISLSARLDADGNAMTRGDTDLSSPVVEGLQPGAEGVKLTLSQRG